jgi:hypothetical protein
MNFQSLLRKQQIIRTLIQSAYDHLIPHYKGDIEKNIFECFTLLSSLAAINQKVKI